MAWTPFKAAESPPVTFSLFVFWGLLEGHSMGTLAWAHVSLYMASPAASPASSH